MSEKQVQQIVRELICKFEANLLAKIHSGALGCGNPPQVDDTMKAIHTAISQKAEAWGLRELDYSPERDGLPNSLDEARVWMQVKHPEHWVDDKSKYEATLQVQRDFQLLSLAKRDPALDLTGLSLPDALKVIREKYPDFAKDLDRRYDPELVIGEDEEEDEFDDDGPQWTHRFERGHLKCLDMQLELLELMFADHVHEGQGVFAQFSVGREGYPDFFCVKQRSDGEEVWELDLPFMKPDQAFLAAVIDLNPALMAVQNQVGESLKSMNIAVVDMDDKAVWLMMEQLLTVLRGRVK